MYNNKLQKIFFVFFIFCIFFIQESFAADWRIKVYDSAIAENDIVTLGDIAEPLGSISPADWGRLKTIQLFAAPNVEGKAFQISKKKLQESLEYVLGDSASYLILPNSLAIQKKGDLLREADLMRLVQQSLQYSLSQLDGIFELTDFRLPPYIFLPTKGQRVELETKDAKAGRNSLKFHIKELDNSTVKRFTGSVFVNLWKDVPAPLQPYNRGDRLEADNLTYIRKNLAYIKGEPWDGKGGPWQFKSAVGTEQPILMSDLAPLAMIRKGQLITIQYQKGNVTVAQQGQALEDGGPGDVINVRNTQSKKLVFGTVLNDSTVVTQ